jgi:hypothetical protein
MFFIPTTLLMPRWQRTPRWLLGMIVVFCVVSLLKFLGSYGINSYGAATSTPQAAPQASLDIPTQTAPPSRAATDDDGMLVDETDKLLRVTAILGVYSWHCGNLPPALDRKVAAAMGTAGKDMVWPHILKVDEVRQRFGNVKFCATFHKTVQSMQGTDR